MFHKSRTNFSPKGERYDRHNALTGVLGPSALKSFDCFTGKGETLRERFKSHKYMKNNIHIKNNINLSPIHPTPARATRDARARIGMGVKEKNSAKICLSHIEKFLVTAVVEDDQIRLVDREGRRIRACMKREQIGQPSVSVLKKLLWQGAIERELAHLCRGVANFSSDLWVKRAKNMELSLRLRKKDRPSKCGHKQLDKWNTTNWSEACNRMIMQLCNQSRQLNSPWKRWATQVAKNQHKRVKSRYGKIDYSNTNN